MNRTTQTAEVTVLERGDIALLYRPKVETHDPSSIRDVQRFGMVLRPDRRRPPMFKGVGD